jgi:transcriptional regulator with XRE-family HTH domain
MKANVCGKRVKLARVKSEMDQVELAAALSVDCGLEIVQTAISDIERGVRRVSDFELIALAKVMDVTTTWLLYGDKGEK